MIHEMFFNMDKVKNILFLIFLVLVLFLKNNSYSQITAVMDNDTSISCQRVDFSGVIGSLRAIRTDRSLAIIKTQDIAECYYPSGLPDDKFLDGKIKEYEKRIRMLREEQRVLTEKRNDLENTREMYETGLQNMESDQGPDIDKESD